MRLNPRELGRWGEDKAADYLIEQGYSIITRNERTPYGEIDLIAQHSPDRIPDETTLVFVEVKTRSSRTFGYPEESITSRKQEHLTSAAQYFMQEHPQLEVDWRIDVISIERSQDGRPLIQHFENALQE